MPVGDLVRPPRPVAQDVSHVVEVCLVVYPALTEWLEECVERPGKLLLDLDVIGVEQLQMAGSRQAASSRRRSSSNA